MRITPAQSHFLRVTASNAAKNASASDPLALATGNEKMLAKLRADKTRLKQVQGLERKAEVKREILPDYYPYIEGVLASKAGINDEVLMTCLVWLIDTGDNARMLTVAEYAITHKLAMPDQYKRSTGCLITEELSDLALKAFNAKQPIDTDTLLAVGELLKDEDMPDEVRSKLHKAIGYGLRETSPESALIHLRRALELNDKAGVKRDIELLERQLKKAATEQTTTEGLSA